MTRNEALAKLLKEYGDEFSISDIITMKAALKWYADDDIDDIYWFEHLSNIFYMYEYTQAGIRAMKFNF